MARIVNFRTMPHQSPEAVQTLSDFQSFLGTRVDRLGIMAQLYPQYTSIGLIEKLGNIYDLPTSTYRGMNNLFSEWQIQSKKYDTVRIMEDVTTDGKDGRDIEILFESEYFAPNDTFVIGDGVGTLLFVKARPQKLGNVFKYTCKLVNPLQTLDLSKARKNQVARFRASLHGEMSSRGSFKKMSNFELFDNCLSFIRVQKSTSGFASIAKSSYIENVDTKTNRVVYHALTNDEKHCLDQFNEQKNNLLLFGQRSYNEARQFTLFDEETGFPIPAGDGLVTQIEQYSGRTYSYSKLTSSLLNQIIREQSQFSQSPQGNQYVIMCNSKFGDGFWQAMYDMLKGLSTSSTYFYSKHAEGKTKNGLVNVSGKTTDGKMFDVNAINVGATLQTYNYQGNQITIVIERALDIEYKNRGYALLLDMSQDQSTGNPAMELVTMKNADMIWGRLNGLGGESGYSSGEVSSLIHASEYAMCGFLGINVYAPQRCAVIKEAIVE